MTTKVKLSQSELAMLKFFLVEASILEENITDTAILYRFACAKRLYQKVQKAIHREKKYQTLPVEVDEMLAVYEMDKIIDGHDYQGVIAKITLHMPSMLIKALKNQQIEGKQLQIQ